MKEEHTGLAFAGYYFFEGFFRADHVGVAVLSGSVLNLLLFVGNLRSCG